MKKLALLTNALFISNIIFSQFDNAQIINSLTSSSYDIKTADIDNDGDLDVISVSAGNDTATWHENDGNGNFNNQHIITDNADFVESLLAVDLDDDGDIDVITVSQYDQTVAWFQNDGNGVFGEAQIIINGIDWIPSICTSDIDNDGDLDIVLASFYDWDIIWWENDGDENFNSGYLLMNQLAAQPTCVYSADLDNDNDNDILFTTQVDSRLSWLENDGNGIFTEAQIISTINTQSWSICASDLDNDGDLDPITTLDDAVVWYENIGNGNFGLQQVISTEIDGGKDVISEDFDGDGDMDIATASSLDGKITVYLNSYGFFESQIVLTDNYNGALSISSGDLDGDGDLDVQAVSFQELDLIWFENLFGNGCTDSMACNYDSFANTDDGSCCYGICGCTDSISNNYNPTAVCEDNSCEYRLEGTVFFDENENGIMDESEYGLPFQEVILEPGGLMGLTNDEGKFFFSGPGLGSYELTLYPNELFPFLTTPNPINFNVEFGGANQELIFGVSNEVPEFDITVEFYSDGNGYPCDDFINHNICYRNMGNVPIDGIVEVEYDPLFQGYQEVTPIDSVVGNHIYMSFENLLPGQMFFYDVLLHTPTVDFIGEWLTSNARVYGYYEGEQLAYGESILVQEMTCSYDPNDKHVFPAGYEEPHYVLNDTELEYLVRFQNTGNAAAINVTVSDTIDENLDLSTFMLLANSHSVMTSIEPETRVIDFFFENIMLPDSTTDEQGSHGLISYFIRPYPELDIETEINNTGYIYFDNNPAIVTNTTWTTIYGCSNDLATIEAETLAACVDSEFSLSNTQDYIESYSWSIDEEIVGTESTLLTLFETDGDYSVKLNVSNPLCEALDSILVAVNPSPNIDITENQDICEGETVVLSVTGGGTYDWNGLSEEDSIEVTPGETTTYEVEVTNEFDCSANAEVTVFVNPLPIANFTEDGITLTASTGTSYQWYLNGTEIDGANDQNYTITEDGNYSVLVTNEFDCSSLSEEVFVMYIGISDLDNSSITLSPNPMNQYSELFFGESGKSCNVIIVAANGQLVRKYENIHDNKLLIHRKELVSGAYILKIVDSESGRSFEKKLIVE